MHVDISGLLGGLPKDGGPLRYKSPLSERNLPSEPSSLIHLRVSQSALLSIFAPMFPNESLGFNIDDLTGLDNRSCYDDNLGFDGLIWDGAGPNQPYLGVDVRGDLDNYPSFLTPFTAPTSLHPTDGAFPNEGKLYCTS